MLGCQGLAATHCGAAAGGAGGGPAVPGPTSFQDSVVEISSGNGVGMYSGQPAPAAKGIASFESPPLRAV